MADLLIGTSGIVEDSTTKDVFLLETQVEICSATPVFVAESVVDEAVTRSGATEVGMGNDAIWLVRDRNVLSDPSEFS